MPLRNVFARIQRTGWVIVHRQLCQLGRRLCIELKGLPFTEPVTHVYNPLEYARSPYEAYLKYARKHPKALLLGMNPGPWGMAQTGVPFGEIDSVRDWLGINKRVGKPENEHPKRPVEGFSCTRSEVSGRRLWGLFSEVYGSPELFFRDHFIINYCPLVFMADSGRNITPDKLPRDEAKPVMDACDAHLRAIVELLRPKALIGIGAFAESCFRRLEIEGLPVYRILHPSPASPAANRDWAGTATTQLVASGVWRH